MIYDKIKALCHEQKIPITKLEKDMGFSRASICKWNENEPSVMKAKKVAEYLHTTVEELTKD